MVHSQIVVASLKSQMSKEQIEIRGLTTLFHLKSLMPLQKNCLAFQVGTPSANPIKLLQC